jgi:hypothetical protein
MIFSRPTVVRRSPLRKSVAPFPLSGLGDLGDDLSGSAAIAGLVAKLKGMIINKAGTQAAGGIAANQSLTAVLYSAADYFTKGNAGSLWPEAQKSWNVWKAQAEPLESPSNIYWALAQGVARESTGLIRASQEQAAAGLFVDAQASKASYLLVDSTQVGTTWYGGSTVTSKLTNGQWRSVFDAAFAAVSKGIIQGLLPFTYLEVLISALCTEPNLRRFPVWKPPYAGLVKDDPRAIAFRAMLKQLGWGQVTKLWFSYTQQGWAIQNEADEALDRKLSVAITTLNYVSGKALVDQLSAKVSEYFAARSEATTAFKQFRQLRAGPLKDNVTATETLAMQELEKQFASTDTSVFKTLSPAGLWPGDLSAGVSSLGAAQFVLGGVVLVAILGMLVWAIGLMTATARAAAAQTKATADSILSTVDEVKASAYRVYMASAKTPADEKIYQDSLLQTKALTDSIPKPPKGGDPLGLKWVAILGLTAIGGFVAWQKFGKK